MSLRQEGRSFDYWYAVDRSCVRMRAVTGRLAQREGEHDTLTIEQVGALTRTDDGTWFPTRTETHYYRRESGQTEWSLDWYLLWVVDELRTSEPGASMFAPLLPNPTRIFMPDGAVEVYGSETALMEEAILKGDLPLVEQMLPSDEELFGEGAA